MTRRLQMKCPKCDSEIQKNMKECPECGLDIENQTKECPNCKSIVMKDKKSALTAIIYLRSLKEVNSHYQF